MFRAFGGGFVVVDDDSAVLQRPKTNTQENTEEAANDAEKGEDRRTGKLPGNADKGTG